MCLSYQDACATVVATEKKAGDWGKGRRRESGGGMGIGVVVATLIVKLIS